MESINEKNWREKNNTEPKTKIKRRGKTRNMRNKEYQSELRSLETEINGGDDNRREAKPQIKKKNREKNTTYAREGKTGRV